MTTELSAYIMKGTTDGESPILRHRWILDALIEEVLYRLDNADATEANLTLWVNQFGNILTWCATGDDSVLVPEMRDFLWANYPDIMSLGRIERLAIKAGDGHS